MRVLNALRDNLELFLAWLLNPLFFRLRNTLKFSRKKPYTENSSSVSRLPNYAINQLKSKRFISLTRQYEMSQFESQLSRSSLYGAYFFLDVLDQSNVGKKLGQFTAEEVKVLDIGTKNFDIAPSIYRYCKTHLPKSKNVHITGIEIDAYRIYRSFFSRYDVAEFYRKLISVDENEHHRYIPGDFLTHEKQYDFISCFFPFVTSYALLAWGLPRAHLKPQQFVGHILKSLNPGGMAVIINQTKKESQLQKLFFEKAKAACVSSEIQLGFREGKPVGYLHVVTKSRN